MQTLPLIAHARPDAVLALRAGESITAARFLHDAHALAERLPDASHVLNLCDDRYHFAVAFAAAVLRGQCSLLPPSRAPEVIRHLYTLAPRLTCLTDGAAAPAGVEPPAVRVDLAGSQPDALTLPQPWQVPQIPADQRVAQIFTSGSTGLPVAHPKRFGTLVQCVRAGAERLPPIGQGGCAVLGTVPAQHMYGFETTVLLPLQSAGILCAERPFFPADIAAALQRLPRPRALCSTPVHLRALLAADTELPPLDLVICATAMLAEELAQQVESRYRVPLLEIYGSTETGQMASRRAARERIWRSWPGVQLRSEAGQWWAEGGHLTQAMPLADVLEPLDAGRFLLHGRSADLVNVAGKRSSLAYLDHQLNSIPGVIDGAFFLRDDASPSLAGVNRVAAFAVAPGMDAAHLIATLRERIDPVFLPRPLLLVTHLPRNATGKLPRQTLHALATQLAAASPGLFE